jgi:RNA polymerase sigma-70 factor (ECF subfamily)
VSNRFFELIVNEHKDMLFVYLVAVVRDETMAEDLVQETFLAAYESVTRGEEVASVPAWLRGIGRNLAMKALARRKRERTILPDAAAVEDAMRPFDELSLGDLWPERLIALRECREKLPEHQKQAVALHYDGDLCAADIEARTGWVRATVYQVLWAARKALRDCIERRLASPGVGRAGGVRT